MKKIILLLFILILASSAFAAVSFPRFVAFVENGHESYDDVVRSEDGKTETIGFTPSAKAKNAPDIYSPTVDQIKNLNTEKKVDLPSTLASEAFIPAAKIEIENEPIILVSEKKGKEGEIVGAVKQIDVEIVPYASKQILKESEIDQVVIAYDDLRKAADYTEIIPDLEDYIDSELKGKLAATQIFFIRPKKEIEEFIDYNELLNLRIIFKKALTSGDDAPVIVVKSTATGKWSTIDPNTILVDWYEDGTFSVDFHQFGTVVFLEPRNN